MQREARVVALIVLSLYLASLALPAVCVYGQSGELSHNGPVSGLKALLFGWTYLCWLANPFFLVGLILLAGGRLRSPALLGLVALALGLTTFVVADHYYVCNGCWVWLTALATLWAVPAFLYWRREGDVLGVGLGLVLLLVVLGVWFGPARLGRIRIDMALGPAGVDALRARLQAGDPQVRVAAANALLTMKGAPGVEGATSAQTEGMVEALKGGLDDPDPKVRARAIWRLGEVGASNSTREALSRALQDSDPGVRLEAASALSKMGAPASALPGLLVALHDPYSHMRSFACSALGPLARSDPQVVQALAGALKDPDSSVRVEACIWLEKAGPAAAPARPALLQAVGDQDPNLVEHAKRALGASQTTAPGGGDADPGDRLAAVEAVHQAHMARGGRPAPAFSTQERDGLEKAVQDGDARVKRSALEALEEADPENPLLIATYIGELRGQPRSRNSLGQDFDRCYAARHLQAMGPTAREAVPALIESLQSPARDTAGVARSAAIRALGAIGPEAAAARPALTQLVQNRDSMVRLEAEKALRAIDGQPGRR